MSSVNTTTLELMYYCNMFRIRRVIVRLITLRTVNTLYHLQYCTCNLYIRDPICITLCE